MSHCSRVKTWHFESAEIDGLAVTLLLSHWGSGGTERVGVGLKVSYHSPTNQIVIVKPVIDVRALKD